MKLTYNIQELPEVARMVLSHTATRTLLFYGDMGVGKTTLIKEVAKRIGVEDTLSSPTFSIVNEYKFDGEKLFHFDFYRIASEEEALDIGIEDYLELPYWKLIEWPEKISNLLPEQKTVIQLTKNRNGSRTINIEPMN